MKLGLAAVMVAVLGASIQCGDASVLSGVCVRDSDCVLDWESTDCCRGCPREDARTHAQAKIIRDQRQDHCVDRGDECQNPGRDDCDWNSRYRAVCRVGACVAEPIEGGAEPLFRAPAIPPRLTTDDAQCRLCERSRDGACIAELRWECDDDQACDMRAECNPECCDEVASTEVGLDEAPWGVWIAARTKPATGLLVFASYTGDDRLGFVELPGRGVVITDVAVSKYEPVVTWVDGTSDFLVETYKTIDRVSFPSQAQRQVVGGSFSVSGLDVSPTQDVALASWLGNPGHWRIVSFPLDPAESLAFPVAWSGKDDTNPRWSPDGKRIALENSRIQGTVAIVDAATGVLEGRSATPFTAPTWHPSGEFLLMWLHDETDYNKPRCEMVVVTPDLERYARLGIVSNIRRCPQIAVSPDGAHVASWVKRDGPTRLELFALGSSQPEQLSPFGDPGVLEWVPLQLSALGLASPPSPDDVPPP
jgi:hypothetical protein